MVPVKDGGLNLGELRVAHPIHNQQRNLKRRPLGQPRESVVTWPTTLGGYSKPCPCCRANATRRGTPQHGGLEVSGGAKCLHNTFGGGLVEMPAIGRRDQAATFAVHEHKVVVVACDDLPCDSRLLADRFGSEFGVAPFELPPGSLGLLGFFTGGVSGVV